MYIFYNDHVCYACMLWTYSEIIYYLLSLQHLLLTRTCLKCTHLPGANISCCKQVSCVLHYEEIYFLKCALGRDAGWAPA